jgi:hypothetical protein
LRGFRLQPEDQRPRQLPPEERVKKCVNSQRIWLADGNRAEATSCPLRLGLRAEKCASGGGPSGARFGWGFPGVGEQSCGQPGIPPRQWRIAASAAGRASTPHRAENARRGPQFGAFFELTLRAGRIAPRPRYGFVANTR